MIQVSTTQGKMKVYLHNWVQTLTVYLIFHLNVMLSFQNLKKRAILLMFFINELF